MRLVEDAEPTIQADCLQQPLNLNVRPFNQVKRMLKNRVNPWGQLVAVPQRGALMGNRGILHDADNQIVKNWAHKSWLICQLSYKEIKRPKPFSPGNYSELFFLDEATAFAAGHRPCMYCQRKRSSEFKDSWLIANVPKERHQGFSMAAVDAQIHQERAARGGAKIVYKAEAGSLPNGAMFEHEGKAFVVGAEGYRPWSFDGYGGAVKLPSMVVVSVLTPRSIVAAFQHGFVPDMTPFTVA